MYTLDSAYTPFKSNAVRTTGPCLAPKKQCLSIIMCVCILLYVFTGNIQADHIKIPAQCSKFLL